jgi:hypothetical protein
MGRGEFRRDAVTMTVNATCDFASSMCSVPVPLNVAVPATIMRSGKRLDRTERRSD